MKPAQLIIGEEIGKGVFKVAREGSLVSSGSSGHDDLEGDVIVKEPYQNDAGRDAVLPPQKSLEAAVKELVVHTVASSLLGLVYDWIKDKMQGGEAAYELPEEVSMRFVKAAVARTSGTNGRGYLLEEPIRVNERGPYLKYIGNGSSFVLIDPDNGEEYERALFLSFVQHAQYELTGGQAFVADFQGMSL